LIISQTDTSAKKKELILPPPSGHRFFFAPLSALYSLWQSPGARHLHNPLQKKYGVFITLYICNFKRRTPRTVSDSGFQSASFEITDAKSMPKFLRISFSNIIYQPCTGTSLNL
jgi:hypothetical protein